MQMPKFVKLKPAGYLIAACFGVGFVIDYFSGFHWIPAGLMALFAVLVNGVAISLEDRELGGWNDVENETPEERNEFKRMVRYQSISAIVVFILGLVSYVYVRS